MVNSNRRPTFTATYICERFGLGTEWRERIQATMNLMNRDNDHNDESIKRLITDSHINTSYNAIFSLIAGLKIGIQIEEERKIQPIAPFRINTCILERENG